MISIKCRAIFCLVLGTGLISTISLSMAKETESTPSELTVIKKYTANASVNGEFEASRRQWLASLRKKRNIEDFEQDKIYSENLESDIGKSASNYEFSSELLDEFIEKIKIETREP